MVLIDSATDLIAMESDPSRSTSSVSKPQWRPEYSNAWNDIYLKGIVIEMFLVRAKMFPFFACFLKNVIFSDGSVNSHPQKIHIQKRIVAFHRFVFHFSTEL